MSKEKKEKIRPAGLAKVAHIFRGLFLGAGIACVVGAVMSFAMNGFINLYYSDPANLGQAANSLDADMGIFKILPFETLAAEGQYGIYFGLQLLCAAVSCAVLVYVFIVIRNVLMNIREKGAAFAPEEEKKYKITFIVVTILLAAFTDSLIAGVAAGLLFGGIFMLTKKGYTAGSVVQDAQETAAEESVQAEE